VGVADLNKLLTMQQAPQPAVQNGAEHPLHNGAPPLALQNGAPLPALQGSASLPPLQAGASLPTLPNGASVLALQDGPPSTLPVPSGELSAITTRIQQRLRKDAQNCHGSDTSDDGGGDGSKAAEKKCAVGGQQVNKKTKHGKTNKKKKKNENKSGHGKKKSAAVAKSKKQKTSASAKRKGGKQSDGKSKRSRAEPAPEFTSLPKALAHVQKVLPWKAGATEPRFCTNVTVYTCQNPAGWRLKPGPGRRDEKKMQATSEPRVQWAELQKQVAKYMCKA
jgi:hypothetical protein